VLTHERRAIQLRITFSWVRKGGKEGEGRRQHDGDQVEGGIMIVPRRDHREMQQGMGSQETRAGNCRGPIPGPPDACGKRQTGDKECCAYVLDEVRGPVSDTPGTLAYQAGPASSIMDPLRTVGTAKTAAIDLRMGPPAPKTSDGGAV
jgi:hypothetical protein